MKRTLRVVSSVVRLQRRAATSTLLVVRFLLIANGITLLAGGGLYLRYGSHPGGIVVGGVLTASAVGLFACIPLTDPYRRERSRTSRGPRPPLGR
jgi:hypothetical protein